MQPLTPRERFLRACRREPVDRPPVWIMRQAGRYLPSYQEVRARASFMELCKTPDLAAEVTVRAVEDLGVDAAILFSDILLPCESMGLDLEFTDAGPRFPSPVRSASGVDALRVPDPASDSPYLAEAIARVRRGIGEDVPLLGFAGAPFTLAAYMTGGEVGKRLDTVIEMRYREPALLERLLDRLVEVVAAHLAHQIDAGCDAVQLFDTWASLLSPADFRRFALGPARRVIQALGTPRPPVIYYMKGSAGVLDDLPDLGCEVISLDWMQDLHRARGRLPGLAVQGNLDPAALFGPEEQVRALVRAQHGGQPGHVFNLGHGILPRTPVSGARAFVAAVKELSPAPVG